jgi:hypothetical protein
VFEGKTRYVYIPQPATLVPSKNGFFVISFTRFNNHYSQVADVCAFMLTEMLVDNGSRSGFDPLILCDIGRSSNVFMKH